MSKSKIYCCLKNAINLNILKEPFTTDDFKKICNDVINGNTYKVFLNKHKKGNGKETELFIKDENCKKYSLIRPFKDYQCDKEGIQK